MIRLLLGIGISLSFSISPVLSQPLFVQNFSASQLEQGTTFYQQGQYKQAIEIWQQALSLYENRGDLQNQIITLNYLSLAYQNLQKWTEAEQAINNSLEILQTSSLANSTLLYAQTLNNRGQLEFHLGKFEKALDSWKNATTNYEQVGDKIGINGSLINQAQALEALGFYEQSCKVLLTALNITLNCHISQGNQIPSILQIFQEQEPEIALLGLRSLGNIMRNMGYLENSQQLLQSALQIPQSPLQKTITLISLGQLERAEYRKYKSLYHRSGNNAEKQNVFNQSVIKVNQALNYYQQASQEVTQIPTAKLLLIQAQVHYLSMLIEWQQWLEILEVNDASIEQFTDKINNQVQTIISLEINNLAPSPTAIYTQLNFVNSLSKIKDKPQFINLAIQIAENSLDMAKYLGDQRCISSALGRLGNIYKQTENWVEAQTFTEQALIISQATQNTDLTYQWQWQLAQIYHHLDNQEAALSAYQAAVNTLDIVRQDLLNLSSDFQYSFREEVEPLYREYLDLLLK